MTDFMESYFAAQKDARKELTRLIERALRSFPTPVLICTYGETENLLTYDHEDKPLDLEAFTAEYLEVLAFLHNWGGKFNLINEDGVYYLEGSEMVNDYPVIVARRLWKRSLA